MRFNWLCAWLWPMAVVGPPALATAAPALPPAADVSPAQDEARGAVVARPASGVWATGDALGGDGSLLATGGGALLGFVAGGAAGLAARLHPRGFYAFSLVGAVGGGILAYEWTAAGRSERRRLQADLGLRWMPEGGGLLTWGGPW